MDVGDWERILPCYRCFRSLLMLHFPSILDCSDYGFARPLAKERVCRGCDRDNEFMVRVNEEALPRAITQPREHIVWTYTVQFIREAVHECSFPIVDRLLSSNGIHYPGGLRDMLMKELGLTPNVCE
jgi:hypothetical protein